MFSIKNLLIYTLIFPIIGILILLVIPTRKEKLLKIIALNFSCFSFISSLLVWLFFQKSTGSFQFVVKFFWLPTLNINFILGIDGISLFFLLLTTLLIPLCILTSWNVGVNLKEFLISFLILDFFFNWYFLCFRFITFLYFF